MTRRIRGVAISIGLMLAAATAHAQTQLKVFVTAAQPVDTGKLDPAVEKELKSRRDAAQHAREDLEKQLKAQHGKNEEAWPEGQQNALADAREAEALATANWEYRHLTAEGLADSAENIRNALNGKWLNKKAQHAELVDSPADADLIIEVVGRRSEGHAPTLLAKSNADYVVSFTFRPGKIDPAALAKNRTYRFKKFGVHVIALQRPRPDDATWRFDAHGPGYWKNAANAAAAMIDDFVAQLGPIG